MFEAPEQDAVVPSPSATTASRPQLIDRFGRVIEYVRVSVTDRCDLRCFY
jgi:cyclic pyranopterin phosphate synthase